jgi:hypothetical protein
MQGGYEKKMEGLGGGRGKMKSGNFKRKCMV